MPSFAAPLVGPGLVVDLRRPLDLSLHIAFDGAGARAFSLPAPRTTAVEAGGFVGDVRRGGSCNCESHHITPHGDGTHTEGVGHLLDERLPVGGVGALMPALLVRVAPRRLDEVEDEVSGNHAPDDRVVDVVTLESAIDAALDDAPPSVVQAARRHPRALVVTTGQAGGPFSGNNPPYLTLDSAEAIRLRGFDHLLVDLPSLDREDDGGLLGAHRAFFDLGPRQRTLSHAAPELILAITARTVTELCLVPADVAAGLYALSLQVAPLAADAAPSRPLLFPLVAAAPSWLGAEGSEVP